MSYTSSFEKLASAIEDGSQFAYFNDVAQNETNDKALELSIVGHGLTKEENFRLPVDIDVIDISFSSTTAIIDSTSRQSVLRSAGLDTKASELRDYFTQLVVSKTVVKWQQPATEARMRSIITSAYSPVMLSMFDMDSSVLNGERLSGFYGQAFLKHTVSTLARKDGEKDTYFDGSTVLRPLYAVGEKFSPLEHLSSSMFEPGTNNTKVFMIQDSYDLAAYTDWLTRS